MRIATKKSTADLMKLTKKDYNSNPNLTWIFQVTGTLALATGVKMGLAGDSVNAGAGSHFEGVVLGQTQITLQTGATANGRLLAQTLVALQQVCKPSLSEIPLFSLFRHGLPLLLD
ncbi:hypothetical protein DFH09DRAFT_1095978 [Mycena vulgaris]|nr:hypothetical protein DFH09DRAFT_1095956 [Mycena vulgaris]KAJ6524715.1 hypothetical protein DFH09DRAFT_1095978 [Mycena vulgaris]